MFHVTGLRFHSLIWKADGLGCNGSDTLLNLPDVQEIHIEYVQHRIAHIIFAAVVNQVEHNTSF